VTVAIDVTDSVSDKLWARLAGQWPPDQLLELIVTAGWYRLISYVINTCGVQRKPWAARFPASACLQTSGNPELARLPTRSGTLVEPSGAAALAALLEHDMPGERVAVVLTGSVLRPEHLSIGGRHFAEP
jgi:hypothetical protein